jgi:pilus assembly protein CpaF
VEGQGEIPLRMLVRNALRMRPDRMILGEARGGEALDVVQAMHLGHDGFITVMHANAPKAALERLQMLMLMSGLEVPPSTCQMQIASAVDLVIHMGRLTDGSRRVERVSQVLGTSAEGFAVEDLFRFEVAAFDPDGTVHGAFQYTGIRPKFLGKFRLRNVKIPSWVTVG